MGESPVEVVGLSRRGVGLGISLAGAQALLPLLHTLGVWLGAAAGMEEPEGLRLVTALV